MKKKCLIVCSLLAIAHAFANNDVASMKGDFTNTIEEIVKFKCEDCLLDFGQASKVVISDDEGHVIFYNEGVEILDISNWEEGSYVVKINDQDIFKFTL